MRCLQVSRIEAGAREPNERFAVACGEVFPQMGGWFTRYYLVSRQAILDGSNAPDLRVLLDESVLTRRIGSPETMMGQIDHLAMMGTRPNITIQVVPEAAGAYAGLSEHSRWRPCQGNQTWRTWTQPSRA